jgi:hypothetical protein
LVESHQKSAIEDYNSRKGTKYQNRTTSPQINDGITAIHAEGINFGNYQDLLNVSEQLFQKISDVKKKLDLVINEKKTL